MLKGEILYVRGMNMTESEDEEEEEDIWDDKKLNDAYDKALRIANAEVAKRVAMSTNSQSKKEVSDKEKASVNKKGKSKSLKKEQWKAGAPCRAVYEGDGQEYEAFVLRIINDKECVVRFLGYENSEIVELHTLKPTQGKEARAQQIEQAANDKDGAYGGGEMDIGSDRVPSPGSTVIVSERSYQRKKKSSKKKKSSSQQQPFNGFQLPEMPPMPNLNFMRSLGSMELPTPPPLLGSLGAAGEEQAVGSMLLAWYMSGYYTGLYQGLKRAKENRRD